MKYARTKFITPGTVIFVGLVFLFLARQIATPKFQTAAEALVGPAMVPTVIASLIIALGSLELIGVLREKDPEGRPSEIADDDEEKSELTLHMIARIVATAIIGFAYIWLLTATGYIISTAITLPTLLVLFGTSSIRKLAIMTIVGTAIYYFVFFRLMGLYDPAGWLINI